jgi:hypothetical protein
MACPESQGQLKAVKGSYASGWSYPKQASIVMAN